MKRNSPEYIGWLLSKNDRAVERAILCLYNRQTSDERANCNTCHCNGRGFSASDVKKGCYMAKWMLSGKHLSGQWLMDAKAMTFKYIDQLVEEVTEKMESQEDLLRKELGEVEHRIDREVAEEKAILESEAWECSGEQ